MTSLPTPSTHLPAGGAMPSLSLHALRSLALFGGPGSGKTALVQALLRHTGDAAPPDLDPLAQRHHHTLQASVLRVRWRETVLQVIDTPGWPDLIGHALPCLSAVDTAVVVIDGVNGPDPQALRWLAQAEQRGLDCMIVITKIDDPQCRSDLLLGHLQKLQDLIGRHCLPLNLPADGGRAVLDCWFEPHAPSGHVPDFLSVESAHRALVEQVVEVDAAFVERYFNEGDIDAHELHGPLEQALREGHLVPVCFVSTLHGAGVAELLDSFEHLLPDASEGNPPLLVMGDGDAAVPLSTVPQTHAPAIAHAFKLLSDPYLGRLAVVRIHQGRLQRDAPLYLGAARKPVRAAHLYRLHGSQHHEVPSAGPGELVALARIDGVQLYDVLHDTPDDGHLHLRPPPWPHPVHGLVIEAVRPSDEQRLWETLARLVDEDPCLRLERQPRTHDTVLYGLGELHLRLLLERLQEVARLAVTTRAPHVAYRETVAAAAEGHHRHKKQSGGAGQFGEVRLRVEPLPRGSGLVFEDAVKGGAIPGAFIPAIEKGVRQAADAGVISGHPVQDVKVTVLDGKHHSVDSKEIAFVTAGRKAFAAAVQAAQPLVLEPVVLLSITVPVASVGDVTGDLAGRRGEVLGTAAEATSLDGHTIVQARVPLAELTGYQSRLNALTSGQGRYTYEASHHTPVPANLQHALVSAWRPGDSD